MKKVCSYVASVQKFSLLKFKQHNVCQKKSLCELQVNSGQFLKSNLIGKSAPIYLNSPCMQDISVLLAPLTLFVSLHTLAKKRRPKAVVRIERDQMPGSCHLHWSYS